MENDGINVTEKDNQLRISKMFEASPERMFELWSGCEYLKHWWGPKEWPMKECTLDFKEEGEWHFCLRGPNEGDESWGKVVYREIDQPNKIVYTDYFSDADGNINNDMPTMEVTVEFVDRGGNTEQVLTNVFESAEKRKEVVDMGVVEGISSSMDRLTEYLRESG